MYIVVRVLKPGRNSYFNSICVPIEEYDGPVPIWDHEYMIIP